MCNKYIVIYYKIGGEGLPSKRSFRRLVANETKNYMFEGSLPPFRQGAIPSKKSSRRLVANETKRYFFEGLLLL